MSILKYTIIFLFAVQQFVFAANFHNDKPCCSKKCTGSEYCSACKNCNGCAHCNSGGYCGVCRPEAYKKSGKNNSGSYKGNNTTVKTYKKYKSSSKSKKTYKRK